jgi:Zn finger protein HypA/HybF involved in hydrogenase expression
MNVNKIYQLSDDEFKAIVKDSKTVIDVLRKVGYTTTGNSWAYTLTKKRMKELNITFGLKYTSIERSVKQIPLDKILVVNSSYNRCRLKSRLVEENKIEYKCSKCGISSWNDSFISLELHHINEINNDNRLENLVLLCPNCHSQLHSKSRKGKTRDGQAAALPEEVKAEILDYYSKHGLRKTLNKIQVRNSLIRRIITNAKKPILMIGNDEVLEFPNVNAASRHLYSLNLIPHELSARKAISKCLRNKQLTAYNYSWSYKE